MKRMVHAVCDKCMDVVDAAVQEFYEPQSIRGKELTVLFEWPVCPECGNRIAVSSFADENYRRLYDAYRKSTGLPGGDEIRAKREKLGLSQKKLADLLGIGVASIQRYEAGSLPTEAHAAMIRRLNDPVFLKQRLQDASLDSVQERSVLAVSVEQAINKEDEDRSLADIVLMMVSRAPDEYTGERSFDAERFRETLVYFATYAKSLYRTKLNKALFYLDFSSYRDFGQGVTGLRYAKANFGPVPDKFEPLIASFVDGKTLFFEECKDGGQVLRVRDAEPNLSVFSPEERARLSEVVEFVNTFKLATDLTEESHKEPSWINAEYGDLLSYRGAATLKASL